jgi:uncharacterized protein (TIGR01777 family)
MKLVIAGGTGFIGSALCARLRERGDSLTLLSRSPRPPGLADASWVQWDPASPKNLKEVVEGSDGVVNLAGEPIAARRWTPAQKERIRQSRLLSTRALVGAIAEAEAKPKFLINASAVGYYGARGDELIREEAPPGSDFLSRVCVEWEREAKGAEEHGVRVVCLRTGIVLGRGGGALAKMVPPFRFFVGGPLGNGRQWVPWIHIEDEVGLILFLMERPEASGAFNGTAPNPVTMRDFARALGKALNRPAWAPVPAFALKLLLGEMAEMLLSGQRAVPARAQALGYTFRYPTIDEALRACLPL